MKAIAVIICLGMLCAGQNLVFGQNNFGVIYGKVFDKETKEEIPFATISLEQKGQLVLRGVSKTDGTFSLEKLRPGKYAIRCSSVGYVTITINGIRVDSLKKVRVEVPLTTELRSTQEVTIMAYKEPLIGIESGARMSITADHIAKMPTRNVSSMVATYGLAVRGNRTEDNKVFINGVRINGLSLGSSAQSPQPPGPDENEEYAKMEENKYRKAAKEPLSTFSIDVDRSAYSNIRRMLNEGIWPPANAVRVEEMINYFEYDYPNPEGVHPFAIQTEYTVCPWNKKHKLVHIGIQGKKAENKELPPNNLVFLIDVSGSMAEPNKLPLVKSCLSLLVQNLRKEDRIAIVVYAGAAGLVLKPTPGSRKDTILDALQNLSAGGSTAGGQGIELAYKLAKENFMENGNNRIILATDGDFNVGIRSVEDLEDFISTKRKEKVYLSVLGFGTGNLKDAKMEALADKGNGNYAYIDNLLEGHKVLVKEMAGTLLTIAKDVKIQVEFNPAFVKKYRLVGYENRKLEDRDFNDDAKDAGELGSGHTVTALYEIIPVGLPEEPETRDSIDALKYQKEPLAVSAGKELLTLKMRYKLPADSVSRLLVHIQDNQAKTLEQSSENCLFACSVASFGMLLRKSKFKGEANFKDVITLAQKAKGKDDAGYRGEFMRLVAMAEQMK